MATPAIGALTFLTLRGLSPGNPVDRFAEITRPNADGHAYADVGKRARVVTVQTEVDTTNATTTVAAYKALIGTFVSVTTPYGRTIASVFVLDVDTEVAEKKVLNPVGGIAGGSWIVTAMWLLQGNSLA